MDRLTLAADLAVLLIYVGLACWAVCAIERWLHDRREKRRKGLRRRVPVRVWREL